MIDQRTRKQKEKDFHYEHCNRSDVKCVYEGWESETYECSKCGYRYTLYDEEMR